MSQELKFNDDTINVVKVIGEHIKSNTQAIRVILIEKNGKEYISLQKWWRRSTDEPWLEGKGFHLEPEEVELLRNDFNEGLDLLNS